MCKLLSVARSTYYYESAAKPDESELENKIETIFHNNHDVYGTRKIKRELKKSRMSAVSPSNWTNHEKAWFSLKIYSCSI